MLTNKISLDVADIVPASEAAKNISRKSLYLRIHSSDQPITTAEMVEIMQDLFSHFDTTSNQNVQFDILLTLYHYVSQ
jgi:hypothetical protein